MYSASKGEIGQHDDRVCLEVGAKLLAATWRASVACSRRVYCVFASDRDFLINNIGLSFCFSSSLNKATLIEASDTAR